jgi:integrase
MAGRRRFGTVRKRESGRWQVRYYGPDGKRRAAPETFARKSDADRHLALLEAQCTQGEWIAPERGKVTVQDYAEKWIAQRPNLRPRTVDLYNWLLRKHITPYLGEMQVGKLDTPTVREWRARLLHNGVSPSMAAKAYRLLRAVLMTAVNEDEMIRKNPCRIKGADQEHAAERPVLTVAQVFALADQMPARYRALVLLTTFACLRWGEATALQRRDIDVKTGTVRIRQALIERRGEGLTIGPPKSRAGIRAVSIPAAILPAIRKHLDGFVPKGATALVFAGPTGGLIWRGNFNKLVKWADATAALGVPGLHFHDLRHTGNTFAAQTKASLKDLMARMGHDSTAAAIIYQHANAESDRGIAAAVSEAIEAAQAERGSDDEGDDGAAGALAVVS